MRQRGGERAFSRPRRDEPFWETRAGALNSAGGSTRSGCAIRGICAAALLLPFVGLPPLLLQAVVDHNHHKACRSKRACPLPTPPNV